MIEFTDPGQLRNPVLVAAFEGWNDAGDASTALVEHLEKVWAAEPLGEIDPDEYYDFQVNRPLVQLVDGITRTIQWPTSRLMLARLADRDVLLLRGLEPNMKWRAFCLEFLEAAHELGVSLVVTVGALLSDSPHSRPVPVTGTASDPALVSQMGLEHSRYQGPTGIVGVFQDACTRAGIPAVSFWGAVPHYVSSPPCPKATLALLHRLEDALELEIPLADLPEQTEAWEAGVDAMAAEDSDVADYVKQLEQRETESALQEASGDALATAFERYLRRQGNQGA